MSSTEMQHVMNQQQHLLVHSIVNSLKLELDNVLSRRSLRL